MGRTRRNYRSIKNRQFGLGHQNKSKRARRKIVTRTSHHALRNQNRYTDQFHFTQFKQSKFRIIYNKSKSIGNLIGQRFLLQEYFEQHEMKHIVKNTSQRGALQDKIRYLLKNQKGGMRISKTRRQSDIFLAAWKKLKRRGTLQPFRGHRNKKQLYKRQSIQIY